MSDTKDTCTEQYPLIDVATEWDIAEQIELAKEWDEYAAVARKENHPVYSDLRIRAFELRKYARNLTSDSEQ